MKSLTLMVLAAAGALNASPVYQCSFNGASFSAAGCYAPTASINTNDFLDWGNQNGAVTNGTGSGLGSAISNTFNVGTNDATPWNTNTANGTVQVGLGIMPTNFTGATAQFDRVDNLGYAKQSNGSYTLANNVVGLKSFGGHFDGPPDATTQYSGQTDYTSAGLTGYQGDHLVGLDQNASGILITFNHPIFGVFFRASAINDTQTTTVGGTPVQDLKVQAYNVLNPTNSTTPMLSYELQDSAAFGTCPGDNTLSGPPPLHPTPCNDAPFIGIDSTSSLFTTAPIRILPSNPWITSIFISSTDNSGFLIDELFVQDTDPSLPEPAMPILMGSGLLLIGAVAKARRRTC